MPLTQPERDNPLMRRYFQEINLPGKRLARLCGVSHSQIYMARARNVGPDNAEKISGGVGRILGLSEDNRLRLKAEIMGHPENLVRAYLGDGVDAAEKLGEALSIGQAVVSDENTLSHRSGNRVLRRLKEMRVPPVVIEAVRARVRPRPSPPGRITNTQSGLEARNRRAEALFYFRLFKPKTAEAFQKSGLSKKDLYTRAGVSRETLRKAMYERVGFYSAREIAHALKDVVGLSESDLKIVEEELRTAPQKNF